MSNMDGEIASLAEGPLQAESLDSLRQVEAREDENSYGDAYDDHAIQNLAKHLSHKKAFQGLSSDYIADKAESLYVLLCQEISRGTSDEQVTKIAQLFGESPQNLVKRLG